jgi:alpha-glucosidase
VEGWNVGWDGDWVNDGHRFSFTESYPDFDVEEVARYARERGVRIVGHHETGGSIPNYESQLEEAYAFEQARGVRAVKTGYVGHGRHIERPGPNGETLHEWHHGQYMVRHHQKVAEMAARYQVMLNIHEPVKGTGLRRTWPNLFTREGARGQEYDAWASDGGNPPDHTTILPFTRMLAGPMDFTPGTFDLLFEEDRPDNRVNTTLAKQLALYVVIYSPLQMASDLVEHYDRFPDAFRFIKDVPTDWDDTRFLSGQIGDYVVVARKERGAADWYLGAITDEVGRSLDVPLGFLEGGKEYVAEIYRDGAGADWESDPYAFERAEQRVTASSTLKLKLAPGGGTAVRFRAVE